MSILRTYSRIDEPWKYIIPGILILIVFYLLAYILYKTVNLKLNPTFAVIVTFLVFTVAGANTTLSHRTTYLTTNTSDKDLLQTNGFKYVDTNEDGSVIITYSDPDANKNQTQFIESVKESPVAVFENDQTINRNDYFVLTKDQELYVVVKGEKDNYVLDELVLTSEHVGLQTMKNTVIDGAN